MKNKIEDFASKVLILGISDAGPDKAALEALRHATFIAGGERHLAFAKNFPAEKLLLKSDYSEAAARISAELERGGRPVVLASGDPLFYGIAKLLIAKLGAARVEVRPYLSAMQLAFARAGLSWEDALLLSVHGRSIENLLPARASARKIGVFTDAKNTPAVCAAFLINMGWPALAQAWICENLEGPREQVTTCSLGDLEGRSFSELNVLLVERASAPDPRTAHAFGLPEEAFAQRKPDKGLITKAELRLVALSKMRLFPNCCAWDIGAATGSVAVEAARMGARRVWAVEKNAEDCDNVRENIRRFGVPQVKVLHGLAPGALAQIPAEDDPDSCFVGGSSGRLGDILDACTGRLKAGGTLVINAITLETQAEALQWFKARGWSWDGLQVQISRRKSVLNLNRFEALNPVTIFWAIRP